MKILAIDLHFVKSRWKHIAFSHTFQSREDFLLHINTGLMIGEWEECPEDSIEITGDDNMLIIEHIHGDFVGLRIMGTQPRITFKNREYPIQKPYMETYIDLVTMHSCTCFVDAYQERSTTYPITSDENCISLLQSISDSISPKFEEFCMGSSRNLKITNKGSGNIELLFEYFESGESWDININIYNRSYRTFIEFPSIQLPTDLRRNGVYSGIIELIAWFMEKYNLGDEIGLIDNSDDEATSRIASKFKLSGDPFMVDRYALNKNSN
jgi:hypothetical protein